MYQFMRVLYIVGPTGNEEAPKKLLNVHGHIHEKASPTVDHRNVSVEQINYRPINIEELKGSGEKE